MFRQSVHRALRAFLPAVILSSGLSLILESAPVHAASGPTLAVKCARTKVHNQLSCWTWGNSFAGGEWVHLTYNVTFLTMPKVNGRRPATYFKRSVKTNGRGTFTRTPRVTFSVVKTHSTFRIAVTALGAKQDKGTTSLAEIGT